MSVLVRNAEDMDTELVREYIYKLAEFEKLTDSCTISTEMLHKLLFEERAMQALIAENDGEAVGFALYYFSRIATFAGKRVLYVEDLFVDEKERGSGAGTAILDTLQKIGAENDCARLEWKCLDWNGKAAEFYDKYGAKRSKGWITYNFEL